MRLHHQEGIRIGFKAFIFIIPISAVGHQSYKPHQCFLCDARTLCCS
jgi:hypothetical protein